MPGMTTRYLDLPNVRIAYREAGSGPNLLLLHGNSESKKIFTRYQAVYFLDYHTYALDSRGHGQSQSVDTQYTIHQYSQDVIAFCREMSIKKTHLVGYSDGANIALLLARDAPQLFDRVVAIAPNYLASGTDEQTMRVFSRVHRTWKLLSRLGLPTHKAAMRYELMLKDIGISAEELKEIPIAMKILYAEKEMIKEEHILEIADFIPNNEIEKIAGASHMNILEQPATIASIQAYLERREG